MAMLLFLAAIACRHIPTEKERQGAEIHYDLGLSAQQGGDLQGAMAEIQTALSLDPGFAEAHNAMGVLLHNGFRRPEEAIGHYKRALDIRPDFSQAKTNLANVYVDQGRYDQAIKLYQEALNDMLYREPHIAQGNLGWALYKKGDTRGALDHIRTAVTLEPKFCLGYQWLGIIETEQRDLNSACRDFGKYREACPEMADAYYREGSCLAKLGQRDAAKQSFTTCQAKAPNESLRGECRRLAEQLH
jgi:tetratricopeptide (TPR) repeat protein